MSNNFKKAVLTIATGKAYYVKLASALIRSLKIWHVGSGIRFALATDQPDRVPADVREVADLIPVKPEAYGDGFAPKLYLDQLAPAEHTLFVDADCLCTGPLEPVFERFAGRSVSVIGRHIKDGEWFGDVKAICRQFDIPAMPRFNGGVYYVEPGPECTSVYETAQSLKARYDEIGFKRLRGGENDEVLMALAMAIHDQEPVPEDGTIMNSTLAAPGGLDIDVLRGKSRLYNPSSHPENNPWYDFEELNPLLVHFLGHQTGRHPYRRESIRLECAVARGWPLWMADVWASTTFSVPWLLKEKTKDVLRPAYRHLFGTRDIKRTEHSRFELNR